MIDIAAVRAATPACQNIIHFNNAGAALMPEPVFRAVMDHLELERNVGGYEAERRAERGLASYYDNFAALLGASADEIAYVENATRAWDMAFYSLPLREGDRILTHESEYASNYLAYLQLAKRRRIEIDVVPPDSSGQIDVKALEAMIGPKSRLIAITHVPTQGGLVNPAAEVGRIARKHGLLYLLDACQSVGQMRVDVREIGCHMLSGTGRKFLRGPRGTGFLYVSREILGELDPPFIDLHSAKWPTAGTYEWSPDARRFENWESYVAGRLGLAEAVHYALALGLENIEKRVTRLAETLRTALAAIPGVTVRDMGEKRCGIVTFDREGEKAFDIVHRLAGKRINVTQSTASSARLDFERRHLAAVVRASVHCYNTEDEIDRFCRAVRDA
jgi:selenocysteine lyase/cysteine desulfurase